MKDTNHMDEKPSVYDYFYYDYRIINCLCELEYIKNLFNRFNSNIGEGYCGYLYLLELSIMNIINRLELIVGDRDVFELIRWGDVTINNDDFKKIIQSHPEGEYIIFLNSIRRSFSKLRFDKRYNEREIIPKLYELKNRLGV